MNIPSQVPEKGYYNAPHHHDSKNVASHADKNGLCPEILNEMLKLLLSLVRMQAYMHIVQRTWSLDIFQCTSYA